MSLTKEEFDERLDAVLTDYIVLYCQVEENPSIKRNPQREAKQAIRQLMLDVTGDPAEDCDFCGSLDSLREIVKGE